MLKIFKFLFVVITTLTISSCNKIKITKEYIENDYWNSQNNAIQITKMKVIDSTLNVLSSDFEIEPNHWNIVDKIEIDTSFYASYSGLNDIYPNKSKLKGKVYFNKDNGWKWLYKSSLYPNQEGLNWSSKAQEEVTIGELENNTWYRFSGLKMNTKFYIYVYVDENGSTHNFGVNLSNY
ncbi:hypothetical protein L0P88_22120 [Muricauda sp. SCSIO 64092]|uniref:hypothetical protein n=1 Tax=Allomuricauda sp. SCSIO 64092 TaxID=2908842 RepID=UPI001FF5BBE8|nr:hypothetical protein [Muricauda sp. SCSIO 64092]UOY06606.1 hypothetical protein L0P88_22120 [Muricauda sp. SCSIO 64092]